MTTALMVMLCFAGGFIIVNYGWPAVAAQIQRRRSGPLGLSGDRLTYYSKVLGVTADADEAAVRAAYLARLEKYDPNRFDEFGPEFREMAIERTKVINAAYEYLLAMHTGKTT
jgi:preprotein translocase subunit Sec63